MLYGIAFEVKIRAWLGWASLLDSGRFCRLGSASLDWARAGWVGLGLAALNWMELGKVGLGYGRLDSTGLGLAVDGSAWLSSNGLSPAGLGSAGFCLARLIWAGFC